jgi:hypothetical protein
VSASKEEGWGGEGITCQQIKKNKGESKSVYGNSSIKKKILPLCKTMVDCIAVTIRIDKFAACLLWFIVLSKDKKNTIDEKRGVANLTLKGQCYEIFCSWIIS